MILATGWNEYQLLDAGAGYRYEQWGTWRLVRPDPQVLWPGPSGGHFAGADAIYHRSRRGGGHWEFLRDLPESWQICYADLRFRIRPTNFKHTGLFPEQAANWDWCRALIEERGSRVRVLNLFGYTGAATVNAARAGAEVTHVDAARGVVHWCRENAELSGLGQAPIRYIVDDCLKFVQRECRRGRKYDAIIMDPPSFGRGKQGETWKIEDHLWELLEATGQLLSENPLFFLINSYTTGLSPTVLENLLRDIPLLAGCGRFENGEVGIPIQADGRVLPAGIYCRWSEY